MSSLSSSSSSSHSSRSTTTSSGSSSLSFSSIIPTPPPMTSNLTPFPSTVGQQQPEQTNGGNNSGNLPSDGPSLASSASLYLYTFLATLVLLLSVSAAIVVRSFLLRRRHRRLIEEAIRNGTWMPPPPGSGRSGARVDLSKKPKMWEVYMDLNGQHQHQQQEQQMLMSMDERDWEGFKPVMATFVHDLNAKKKPSSNQNDGAGAGVNGDGSGAAGAAENDTPTIGTVTQGRRLFRRIATTLGRAMDPTPSGPQFGQTAVSIAANNARQGSNPNLSSGQQDLQMSELSGSSGPKKVRVAVLIAMPRPNSTTPSTSHTTSPSTSRSASSGSTPPQVIPHTAMTNDEEEELPHIEMGVAELVVTESSGSTSLDMGSSSAQHHLHHVDPKGKIRESMASMGSV
ncbi:hypothetical protein NP233_g1255 [Leucocoprinus birnbaumii]|uniref:Uncharacterized protein n=1 Tax=Leucocoprinus birnbaumii TaxID=56174 RepID=A0AAD5W091_9AGAR|nr:hypothetical protein NP233_g1255 [Leucocoprinus birnbaumii]